MLPRSVYRSGSYGCTGRCSCRVECVCCVEYCTTEEAQASRLQILLRKKKKNRISLKCVKMSVLFIVKSPYSRPFLIQRDVRLLATVIFGICVEHHGCVHSLREKIRRARGGLHLCVTGTAAPRERGLCVEARKGRNEEEDEEGLKER